MGIKCRAIVSRLQRIASLLASAEHRQHLLNLLTLLHPVRSPQAEGVPLPCVRDVPQLADRLQLTGVDVPSLSEHVLPHMNVFDEAKDERRRHRTRVGMDDIDRLEELVGEVGISVTKIHSNV